MPKAAGLVHKFMNEEPAQTAGTNNVMTDRRGRSVSSDAAPSTHFLHHDDREYEMCSSTPSSRLSVLKTKAESRALAETIKVWIVELPVKAANDILMQVLPFPIHRQSLTCHSVCRDQIPDGDAVDLQHLRRFAKANVLPIYLQPPGTRASSVDSRTSTASSGSNSSKSTSRSRSRMRKRRNSAASTLHLLICPVAAINQADLTELLLQQPPFAVDSFPLRLREITVPLLAPTSVEQAQQWTAQYWPTLYRKTNPFGPHPSLVARAEDEIRDRAGEFMDLARQASLDSSRLGFGISAGCVVVERKPDQSAAIVAVAGDARHSGLTAAPTCGGNTACHAAMRAIGMVARKRVRVASPKPAKENIAPDELLVKPVTHAHNTPESVAASLVDYPVTPLEQEAFDKDNLIADGYLCVDLEMYLTHEPCLMCSMAIVHSRFARCVFASRMPQTGGMAGDSGLGYGLFWRSELNWKLLCWDYAADKGQESVALEPETQV